MALTHRGKTATWVLPSTVFPGWTQHWDLGEDRLGVPLGASPGALPWWCETVGRGIGRTSRLSGDLTVASCMAPKVRSLDGAGVVCVLLCVELNPCRLHVVLLR